MRNSHSRRGRVLGAALAALLWAVVARAAERGPSPGVPVRDDPGCGSLVVVEVENQLIYRLPRTFLHDVADSIVSPRTVLRERHDYVLDRLRGELRLLRAPVPGETLRVVACWLLTPPALEYRRESYVAGHAAKPESAAVVGLAPARPATAHDPAKVPGGAALTVSGNKTIAVEFGTSQDAFLRQSLDLALSGTLAPGVQLTGVLSDRNTPLTAGGSTQDLQSLDRVLLELKAPSGGAAFGDVSLDVRAGEFARVERRLQGVSTSWTAKSFTGSMAAASAQGEFHRMQFNGVDGQQGPYLLTDRDGGTGITVVAGSEIVTVDGQRMTRGEGADYSIEYDRARVTFSNRRPITANSRITVDYQFTLNRYRRSFAAAGGAWDRGPLQLFTEVLSEGDDKGRPLDAAFDASDRLSLALAGDSVSRAVGVGVTPGGGDYDTVRVSGKLIFAFAGPDSGEYSVRFVQVGPGLGDYADSSSVAGRVLYRYVGTGAGQWRIGRALPLPESHQLWTLGGRLHRGALTLDAEGAVSRLDLNTASPLDDQDNGGGAARLSLALEGGLPARLGRGGLRVLARNVGGRFSPFGRLEQPFSQEDWGLPLGGDLEHQRRLQADGFVRPRPGGEFRWSLAALETPTGFRGVRRSADWNRDAKLVTRAGYERADGTQQGLRFDHGGRERGFAELRVRAPWLEPGVRAESDVRWVPSDTAAIGVRTREGIASMQSGASIPWKAAASFGVRRDANAQGIHFLDYDEARTLRLALETPPEAVFGVGTTWQRRDTRPLGSGARLRSDLASLRMAAENPVHGFSGNANLEVTAEGESRRVRSPVYVGNGGGAFDSLGNFVGHGDYDLGITVLPGLDRIARAATSARVAWSFGANDAWRGSRVEFGFESDARRRGDLLVSDLLVSPWQVLGDTALSRGSVDQRLESDLAPGARLANLRLRLERRVTSDRSFDNFAQTIDERTGLLRWRARAGLHWSTEIEGRLRRQSASQQLYSGANFERTLIEQGGNGQLIFQPGAVLRAAGVADLAWSRPDGQTETTRTLQVGPDVSAALGPRGRADFSLRRAFVAGPPSLSLLPGVDPAGAARWQGTAHADLRVHPTTTMGVTWSFTDRPGLPTRSQGRVELRAFF
jgi:hypothetical protein